ncbi:unnamed protein product [Microthlaspi erraticum]|uniref:Transposase MuDR plant domain-containing protein n=1 Tax=Microthlaspi erraticum TaxID=1685480 RepID=A0A6D2HEA4_9BRAS|nr:unnamed protein product [Microthlaspi erraticum]
MNAKPVVHDAEDASDDEDDEGDRLDWCDDEDGASSGDEDYDKSAKVEGVEEEMETDPPKKEEMEIDPPKKEDGASEKKKSKVDDEVLNLEKSSIDLAVGQRYDTKYELETRLKVLTVTHKFDFNVGRSTPMLLTVECWVKGCKWRVRATTIGDSHAFHIKVYKGEHSCSVTERSVRSRQATHQIYPKSYSP